MRSDEIVVGSYHESISYHRLLTILVLGDLRSNPNRQEEFLASVTCDSAYSSANPVSACWQIRPSCGQYSTSAVSRLIGT